MVRVLNAVVTCVDVALLARNDLTVVFTVAELSPLSNRNDLQLPDHGPNCANVIICFPRRRLVILSYICELRCYYRDRNTIVGLFWLADILLGHSHGALRIFMPPDDSSGSFDITRPGSEAIAATCLVVGVARLLRGLYNHNNINVVAEGLKNYACERTNRTGSLAGLSTQLAASN